VVDRQASMLAFDRLFLLMGIALICGACLLVFFRTGRRWVEGWRTKAGTGNTEPGTAPP